MDNALAQPQVFDAPRLHAAQPDAGARAGPAVLDFQDACSGPIAYDAVSLFKDAFLSWPLERVDALARALPRTRRLPPACRCRRCERFRRDADWIGMQRHLKILGIFARLHYRDGKAKYLPDAPRFIAYLDTVLPRYPELAPLADMLDRARAARRLQERAHA